MARDDGYLSARGSWRISKENRKITAKPGETRTRWNVSESKYMAEMENPVNAVRFENPHIFFLTGAGTAKSIDSVSFEVPLGKTVGIVGKSGCDKSMTGLSLMQLSQRPQGQAVEGSIRPSTEDKVYEITKTPGDVMQHLRNNFISMIFQGPMTSLNPVSRIGDQMDEVTMLHKKSEYPTKEAVKGHTIGLLGMVDIANSEGIYNMYPHELSDGMRQRVTIAMAPACSPKLIIADESTTTLDVTIQTQTLDLLRGLKDKISSSIMLVARDLGAIAETTDYAVVIYSGRAMETETTEEIFSSPVRLYTIDLMASKPVVGRHQDELCSIPGRVPSPVNMPNYCYFRDRCDKREGCYDGAYSGEIWLSETHRVSCYRCDETHMGSGQSKTWEEMGKQWEILEGRH